MSGKRYNGWANYATWRVNLEMLDGLDADEVREQFDVDEDTSAYDLGKSLESYVDELLDGTGCDSGPVRDYCDAFLSDVDWTEIAQHFLDDMGFDEDEED